MTAATSAPRVERKVVPRIERKAYVLTAAAWRTLEGAANAELHGFHARVRPADLAPLERRGLLEVVSERGEPPDAKVRPVRLTDLGQRVYSRLSVGPFCAVCRKPVLFVRRVNEGVGRDICEPCHRRQP